MNAEFISGFFAGAFFTMIFEFIAIVIYAYKKGGKK